MSRILVIDIGSTWTKGTVFELAADGLLEIVKISRTPTTVEDLVQGFGRCRRELDPEGKLPLFYSSSAKGGLRIAALGIVPDLTLKMAKEAACSAGGKIAHVFAYRLNEDDIAELAASRPDIVLFSGGTDGGNESCLRHNLELLKSLPLDIPLIYAGNRTLQSAVRRALEGHDVRIVENLLPELEHPNPEPAREAIRDIFLQKIISGRGLDRVAAECGGALPLPTPYVMLEFLKKFYEFRHRETAFAVVDMGGATTDFYSACVEKTEAMVIRRGLPEPPVKRTVEGDIGMRVSAQAAFEETQAEIASLYGGEFRDRMARYIEKVASDCSYLPESEEEKRFDRVLAGGCCTVALRRHAGRRRQVFTANGPVALQTGRNLRSVEVVIASGGYLSRLTPEEIRSVFWETPCDPENEILVPAGFSCIPDRESLLIMLANASCGHPDEACRTLARWLNLPETETCQ